MKRFVCFALALALLVAFASCGQQAVDTVADLPVTDDVAATPADPSSTAPDPAPEPEPEPEPDPTVRFSASGDNLIHAMLYMQAQARTDDGSYDFMPLYASVADYYAAQDLNFINQETLVNDELPPSHYPQFSSPGAVGHTMYDLGFRLFGTSNNHSYDKGAVGIAATRRFWAAMPQDALAFGFWENGKEDEIPLYEQNGITFACLAYTQYTNGIPTPADAEAHVILTSEWDTIQSQVTAARQLADVVLVSVHWGVEDSHTVTDGQRQLAQQLADLGVDLIIGTHPHVLQSAEWLDRADGGKSFVMYSLGNFVSAQSKPDQVVGAVFSCTFTKSADGPVTISDPCFHPTVTHYGGGFDQVRLYFLKGYTPEQAAGHGVRAEYPYFDIDYIRQVVAENLPAEFLEPEFASPAEADAQGTAA